MRDADASLNDGQTSSSPNRNRPPAPSAPIVEGRVLRVGKRISAAISPARFKQPSAFKAWSPQTPVASSVKSPTDCQ
ncbi:hypothetical protein D3C71_1282150 [compost metagenome]